MENIIKNVKCKIVRQIYASNNFRTFGCILTDNKDEDKIVLNKYGNFTISGDLPFLNEGEEYTLDLKETVHPRFGVQYSVDKVADYEMMNDLDHMPVEQSKEILTKFTTEKQADTLLSVYPNFISMIINGKANEIDLSKLRNIKEYRMNCNMTQEFVAEALGVSRQAVSKWESGTSSPSTTNLIALAKLFGVEVEELLKQIK